ncbi:50S ribosomal protein L11 methyltransferase [Caldibacillus thermolactis]|jgi:ribosomal protein L11 methyltransferase|uniref:Ribosomal protein L11 methyltransferase n=1 Tax=Pallidibacillus thermolactis TaxID=251051 RepID=A0ABT2WBV3_9BACI|nr:50S ribosomal protein L11 methyltransferase [Pallidibacillus thermolactis]MCU9592962.1 50S ribosomal protein L11 methyltransferase [Pallidibacillus thermolactis]MCU9600569.1 50S ribosomal protein L11 methyltransferase [Pallidibacillus thermolactis subsp. kokeshiiformis]
MKWSEISIHTTNEAVEPIANILYEAGASGIVIEDSFDLNKDHPDQYGELYELNPDDFPEEGVIVKAYLPVNSFLGETVEQIKSAINNLLLFNIDIGLNKVTISEVHEEEWSTAWKKYYHPVKISSKFTIVPTWEEYEPVSSDELMIELDPGMAFGTGTHPTTVMSIQALEQTVKKDDIVYDVGTGSGVLSIASAMLGAKHVLALDLDEIAVKSAELNIKINHIQDRITVKQNNLLDGITEPADVIVANLLAEIIVRFTDDAFRLVKDGGYFITSGIINQKRQEVEEQIIKAGFEIVETIMMEDWVTIVAKK